METNNQLVIIRKIEKYIEYMLTILIKLPRTEKFSIGTEIKTSMYDMLKNILFATKIEKKKRLEYYNIVDSNIYYQRICIRIMYNNKWIDMQKYKYSNEMLSEIGKMLGGRGFYVSTVGNNKSAVYNYVENQLKEDMMSDQITIKEYKDPFKG